MTPLVAYARWQRWSLRIRRKNRLGQKIEQWELDKLWQLSRDVVFAIQQASNNTGG